MSADTAMRQPPRPQPAPRTWVDHLYEPRTRAVILQVVLVVALGLLAYEIVSNTIANLRRQNIASGFGFLNNTAGFDISQHLISYRNTDTYGRAFLVGLLNTLLVATIGIVFATVLGFVIGIARLSRNPIAAWVGGAYVEIVRNVPPLLQLFAWYFAVLKSLPGPRQSVALPFGAHLNIRGLFLPYATFEPGIWAVLAAFALGAVGAVAYGWRARQRRLATGERAPVVPVTLGLVVLLPLAVFLAAGVPVSFDYPRLVGFNFTGGMVIQPEFTALVLGLTFYTAAFIAEIVRAGIAGVPKGQTEAAAALGLRPGLVLRLVVIPQAMRIIIPPLTNQYLNLTKNSSLAVAIGYPDLVSVFAGTVLNQTNQAVEVILITMAVYLFLSLMTSLAMGWFNARMAVVER